MSQHACQRYFRARRALAWAHERCRRADSVTVAVGDRGPRLRVSVRSGEDRGVQRGVGVRRWGCASLAGRRARAWRRRDRVSCGWRRFEVHHGIRGCGRPGLASRRGRRVGVGVGRWGVTSGGRVGQGGDEGSRVVAVDDGVGSALNRAAWAEARRNGRSAVRAGGWRRRVLRFRHVSHGAALPGGCSASAFGVAVVPGVRPLCLGEHR